MSREWIVALRDQCICANVPFYCKQWGGFPKAKLGCEFDGKEYKAPPPMSHLKAPSLKRRRQIRFRLTARLKVDYGIPRCRDYPAHVR